MNGMVNCAKLLKMSFAVSYFFCGLLYQFHYLGRHGYTIHLHYTYHTCEMWFKIPFWFQAGNCAYTTRKDIAYWGIDELLVEPCCAVKYYSEIEICIKELDTEEEEKQREIEREKVEDFGPTWYGKLRKKLWNLFEYPQTSRGAQVCLIDLIFAMVFFPMNFKKKIQLFKK